MRVRCLAAVLAGAVAGVTFTVAGTAQASYPGRDGRIAFASDAGIHSVRPDGSGLRRLTSDARHSEPVWSPDGRRIAFVGYEPGRYDRDIYVMDADGANRKRVTTSSASEDGPTWSPDGTRLAFVTQSSNTSSIYTLRSTAPYGRRTLVAHAYDGEEHVTVERLAWSPRGDVLAYTATRRDDRSDPISSWMYTVSAHGDAPRPIATPGGDRREDRDLSFAPSGRKIAFETDRPEDGFDAHDIAVSNVDGSGKVVLTGNRCAEDNEDPAWSPSGNRIAFVSSSGGTGTPCADKPGLAVMNADGTGQRLVLPDAPLHPRGADWQPLQP